MSGFEKKGGQGTTPKVPSLDKAPFDELQAAVLRVKLARLDAWNGRRRELAGHYVDALDGTGLGLPRAPSWADPVWHLFVVRSARRDALREHLDRHGVGTGRLTQELLQMLVVHDQ